MDSKELRSLAEDNLGLILTRAKAADGRLGQEDAALASLFCRVVEAETGGGPYTFFPSLKDAEGALALASRGARADGGVS